MKRKILPDISVPQPICELTIDTDMVSSNLYMINAQPTSSTVISNMTQKYLNQDNFNSPRSDEHRHHWIRYIIIVIDYCKNSDLLFQHIISPIISKRSKVFWYVFAIYHAIMPETKLTTSNSVKLGTGIILPMNSSNTADTVQTHYKRRGIQRQ